MFGACVGVVFAGLNAFAAGAFRVLPGAAELLGAAGIMALGVCVGRAVSCPSAAVIVSVLVPHLQHESIPVVGACFAIDDLCPAVDIVEERRVVPEAHKAHDVGCQNVPGVACSVDAAVGCAPVKVVAIGFAEVADAPLGNALVCVGVFSRSGSFVWAPFAAVGDLDFFVRDVEHG